MEVDMQKRKYKIDISADTGVFYQDAGPWRSYELEAYGDTVQEALDGAYIYEIDQDGGELNLYSLEDASSKLQQVARMMIDDAAKKVGLI
jgi:hypothetical protein